MREYLLELLETTGDLQLKSIALRIIVSIVIAAFIFLSYRLSHSGSIYSRKFNVSLVALTVITATVMIVIGNNIALSLGMVGALSIVRFRTAIKDSRDTVYIFWAIVAGICCGAGDYVVAALGSAGVFVVLLLFGRIRNDNRALLILRTARNNEQKVEALFFQYYDRKAVLRSKNTTPETVEFIYELNGKYLKKPGGKEAGEKTITEAVYEIGSIEYFNIVMQNDDIAG